MTARNWPRLLLATACTLLLACALTPAARAADPEDQNDPALKRAGKQKMTQQELTRTRTAELESGATNAPIKTPKRVAPPAPPLNDHEKVIQPLNRLSFGWR